VDIGVDIMELLTTLPWAPGPGPQLPRPVYEVVFLDTLDTQLSFCGHTGAPARTAPFAQRLLWARQQLQGRERLRYYPTLEVQYNAPFAMPKALKRDPARWKGPLRVKYPGPGIDQGGLRWQWLNERLSLAVAPETGLLAGRGTDAAQLFFTPAYTGPLDDARREKVELFGYLIGKAVVEGVSMPAGLLPEPLLARLLGHEVQATLGTLERLDASLADSIRGIAEEAADDMLVEYPPPFAIPDPAGPAGAVLHLDDADHDATVTPANRPRYAELAVKRALGQYEAAQAAFVSAFHAIVPAELLAWFDLPELSRMISGPGTLDLAAWRAHTDIVPPTAPSRPTHLASPPQIRKWFFEILEAWQKDSPRRLNDLLLVLTGHSQPPGGKFAALAKRFKINSIDEEMAAFKAATCNFVFMVPGLRQEDGKEELAKELLAFAKMAPRFNEA
jgi:hypothetical protein